MIELRWINRGVEYYPENEGQPMRYEKVLQYRQRIWRESIGPFGDEYSQWTEWQDVPTVSSDAAGEKNSK